MNNIQADLARCFSAVFPSLPESQIVTASLETVAGWDSVATATLVTMIEEEFGVEFDVEALSELTSYQAIYDYLSAFYAKK